MSALHPHPSVIDKAFVSGLKFPQSDVLTSQELRNKRRADAERAMLLGNNYKCKVKIVFEDNSGIKEIETTIWSVTEKYILLKTSMQIPLHRVLEVKF